MKISILIPTIRPSLLNESLVSAQLQTHADLEILVSDDSRHSGASTFVLDTARFDPRVRLLPRNPRPGLYENYNYLLKHVTGEAFGILDDDDRWLPDFVSRLAAPLAATPTIVASFCDHWVLAADGRRLTDVTQSTSQRFGRAGLADGIVEDGIAASMRGALSVVFSLFRTEMLRGERFDYERCGGAADLDYAMRAAIKGPVYYVSERLGEYRAHPSRTTATRSGWIRRGLPAVFEKYTFTNRAHERLRRQLLRLGYRQNVWDACTHDREEWMDYFRQYRASGGSVFHPAIAGSCLLAALPHGVGSSVRERLGGMRRRLLDNQ